MIRKEGSFMWKKLVLMVLVLALISVFTIPPAEAGSMRHRVLKALALGGLLAALPPPPVFVSRAPEPYYYPLPREYVPGHWEMTREWVPGTWERVSIPGYYDRWGRWVAGHYENRQIPGYYAERRVWIEGYYRSY
jgi:Zn-dependent protease with chaperone function